MKPTRILSLVLAVVITAPLAWLTATLMVVRGLPSPISGLNISVTLIAVGLVILGLAWPIYRYRSALKQQSKQAAAGTAVTTGTAAAKRPARVDPFYAVRVLVLSKAITFTSTLFIGWHLGVVLSQVSALVVVAGVWKNVFALVAAVLSLVASLTVERICRLPDDGTQSLPDASEAAPA